MVKNENGMCGERSKGWYVWGTKCHITLNTYVGLKIGDMVYVRVETVFINVKLNLFSMDLLTFWRQYTIESDKA